MMLFSLAPGVLPYTHPLVVAMLALSALLFVCAFFVGRVRNGLSGTMKKVSKSWGPLLCVFGVIGVILAVSRAEGITYFSMPFLAFLWALLLIVIFMLQFLLYRRRAYVILPQQRVEDPREKYLPKPKRR